MKLLGFNITRGEPETKAPGEPETKALNPVYSSDRGWINIVKESFAGAWQRGVTVDNNLALSFHAVFSCITLIASDVSKLRIILMEQDENRIWSEVDSPAYSPVLRKPNDYQTRNQFMESWLLSKLTRGNTYVLKVRDANNIVRSLYVLNPDYCRPMISVDGSVFYELRADGLNGVYQESVMVPAREIIHDRMNTLFHPLCGLSPIFACGLAAMQGLKIQHHSAEFFDNNARPGGILSAEVPFSPKETEDMHVEWEKNFGPGKSGRLAILGGGLKYTQLAMSAVDAQLIEQLRWPAEVVCGVFHVPPYKVNVGPQPLNNNVQSLNIEYFSQCLQTYLEHAEACLNEGLGIGPGVGPPPFYSVKFDIDNLLRMDTESLMRSLKDGAGIFAPNESRARINLPPKHGGDSIYMQEQNYSLEALARRDAKPDPFATASPAAAPPPASERKAVSVDDIMRSANQHE